MKAASHLALDAWSTSSLVLPPHWSPQSIKAQQPCYMSRALIIELLLTALYLIVEMEKSFMDCNFWHKLCCWGHTNGCLIAARLVVSAAGAILDREKTNDVFAFLFCLGVCRRCGWPQDKEAGGRGRRVRKVFLPHPLGWFVSGEGRGKPWS